MKQRWYDNDPTISMAVSLLQNASQSHQELAARYMFQQMKSRNLLDCAEMGTRQERLRFIFPGFRRKRFEMHARHLVELIKHLKPESQQEMAVELINYMYMLDCGMEDYPLAEDNNYLAQPESG